ncbi:sister chromatid cohesion protein 1 [Vermiconidia calcicola]|uniref:Sister chromatid cohesion protein 1 n=1 Tax=Vermiconidia calcicola TaxID=1690605 RepID=A0ACC3MZG0_9PEZI|nr:sister chromatid cohesion protein 1 [Vermiconidia calcicola]
MFYSETLLAKTGPLARVWLASNMERKLTKQHVLTSNLENNVNDIMGQGQAPLALRLSGQLLLGVVKIYSRKAKYLLDDCNEALVKIKIAFRPGNVDLPNHQQHVANPNTLILPDAVTELDLFAPLPDPEELLRDDYDSRRGPGKDPTLLDFGTSQLLPEESTPRRQKRQMELDDLDLKLDFGEPAICSTPMSEERSVEVGRRAHTPRRDEPTLLDDLDIDIGLNDDTTLGGHGQLNNDNDQPMLDIGDENDAFQFNGDLNDNEIAAQNAAAFTRASEAAAERRQRERDSLSPLSELRASEEREIERTFQLDQEDVQQQEDSTMVQAAQQRVKRRKVMQQDSETQLHNSQIKKQQADTSGITRQPVFLPRDPLLLQLMEMQRTGSFVSNIMGNGRMEGWAPELRGILSLEVVKTAGERKRKRDSGIADVETDGERQETLQLQLPLDEEDEAFPAGAGANNDFAPILSDGLQPPLQDETLAQEDEKEQQEDLAPPVSPGFAAFDQTEYPLNHPSQTGPVSQGTKTAVHLLRAHFAPNHPTSATEPPTPSKRVKAEAMFTDLCPEATTSRQDATKMFFELLVLGTKDAVKVEQEGGKGVGAPVRVRGKRGLWGDWAESGSQAVVGAEIVEQEI